MPTIFELFTDPVSIAFFGIFAALWALEACFPARPLPGVPLHRLRGVVSLLVFFLVSSYLPYWLAPRLAGLQLVDLSGLGTWTAAALVMLTYQGLGYAYHRALHGSDWLFRGLHQLHHSAERLDVASAFLFSPLDMIGWTVVSTLALTLLGVTAQATVVFVLAGTLLSVFQHSNLRTPRLLGYFVQRPESHSHHHARGAHRNNYADLPIFDLLFGTFHNPATFAAETGYYPGASSRVAELLLGRDISGGRRSSSGQCAAQPAEAPAILRGSQTH